MKRLLALFAGFLSLNVGAGVDIKHDEFIFKLGGDWVVVPSNDKEQFSFESKSKNTSVVLSVMTGMSIPKERLVELGEKLMETRLKNERELRKGQLIQFGDKWVKLRESKDVAEIAYAGRDKNGTIFRFFGFVTERKVLSFWVATTTADNEFSKRVFDECYKGLKFYVP